MKKFNTFIKHNALPLIGAFATLLVLAGFENNQTTASTQNYLLEAETLRHKILQTIHNNHRNFDRSEENLLRADIDSHYRYHGEITFLRTSYWKQQDRLRDLVQYINDRKPGNWKKDSVYLTSSLQNFRERNNFLNQQLVVINEKLK